MDLTLELGAQITRFDVRLTEDPSYVISTDWDPPAISQDVVNFIKSVHEAREETRKNVDLSSVVDNEPFFLVWGSRLKRRVTDWESNTTSLPPTIPIMTAAIGVVWEKLQFLQEGVVGNSGDKQSLLLTAEELGLAAERYFKSDLVPSIRQIQAEQFENLRDEAWGLYYEAYGSDAGFYLRRSVEAHLVSQIAYNVCDIAGELAMLPFLRNCRQCLLDKTT